MKKIFLLPLLFFFSSLILIHHGASASTQIKGTSLGDFKSDCDYYAIEDSGGSYSLAEWYGGITPNKGDVLYGELHSYGFKDLYDLTMDMETRVWMDDYLLSESSIYDKLVDKCGISKTALSYFDNISTASSDYCEESVLLGLKVGSNQSNMLGSYFGSKNGEASYYYDKNCKYPLINSDITYMSSFVQKTCSKSISYQDMFKWGKIKSIDNNWGAFNKYYLDLCPSKINSTDAKITSAEKIDNKFTEKQKGKILLQVESSGEAWYVNPRDGKRYYMANGDKAYEAMRNLGVGITNSNLDKIKSNKNLAKKSSGKIFLQVESHGEAYYIDFNGNALYLKDGSAAYEIMRSLGLGITNDNLNKISQGN